MPKKASEIGDDPGSIGGSMRAWSVASLAWACRSSRTGTFVPEVFGPILSDRLSEMRKLADKAERNGFDAEWFRDLIAALEETDEAEIQRILDNKYAGEYGDDGWQEQMTECPFEETGMDKACWRCKVPGRAKDEVLEQYDGD